MRCCNLAAFHSGAKKSDRFNFQIRNNYQNRKFVIFVLIYLKYFSVSILKIRSNYKNLEFVLIV